MRRDLSALTIIVALVLGDPVAAQQAENPTAEGASAARIIERANARDIFITSSSNPEIAIHRSSGLMCNFGDGAARNQIIIFPNSTRGDDIACNMPFVGGNRTYYATRNALQQRAIDELHGAASVLLARFPDAIPFEGPTITLQRQDIERPEVFSVAYIVHDGGTTQITSVHVATRGDWIYKMRYTRALPTQEEAAESFTVAQLFFVTTLAQMAESRKP